MKAIALMLLCWVGLHDYNNWKNYWNKIRLRQCQRTDCWHIEIRYISRQRIRALR